MMRRMYVQLSQYQNNIEIQAMLPEQLCCYKWMRIAIYAVDIITFGAIAIAILDMQYFKFGTILQKLTSLLIFVVLIFCVYGICLACCLHGAFNKMQAG